MYKILFSIFITLNFSTIIFASTQIDNAHLQPISQTNIKKMDHTLNKHKTMKRNFKTPKEFHHKKKKQRIQKKAKHLSHSNVDYRNGNHYESSTQRAYYAYSRQRGYAYSKRGWILAYKYDRASFYDNQGYFYGYFNRYGYYFEDVFYSYDKYYTYRDRVRGRGLFDHRYYMPANARYYGFCETRHNNRNYERGYDRY
jgi:hypothetical protein